MNRSFKQPGIRIARGGFSLLEILVAVSIALIFLGAAYSSFITILRAADEAEARAEAVRGARSAIMTLTDEIKSITRSGSNFLLVGFNETAAFGNGADEDDDGTVDEEVLNGRDDDNDWDIQNDDLHAAVPVPGYPSPFYDRYTYCAQAPFDVVYGRDGSDLGDFKVDEDCKFGRDSVVFRVFPTSSDPTLLFRTITYTLGSFDGQNHVLIRQARTEFSNQAPVVTTAPLAFQMLGFDLLYWDPNKNPNPASGSRANRPYWMETWNSTDSANFDPPKLPLPASIFARVTLYADPRPFDTYKDGERVETIHMDTVVNIEETIGDALYPRPTL